MSASLPTGLDGIVDLFDGYDTSYWLRFYSVKRLNLFDAVK